MSKELIEQLANKYGTKIRKFGQRHYTYEFNVDNLEAFAKAYAQTQGQSIQEGWKLVPIEPTDEMIAAPFEGKVEDQDMMAQKRRRDAMADNYKAMIKSSPTSPIERDK